MKELCIEPGTCGQPVNDGWQCADDNGHAMDLLGDIPHGFFDDLYSGMTYLDISEGSIVNGGHAILIADGATLALSANEDIDEELARRRGLRGFQHRNLLDPQKTGTVTVLVVRVEDMYGSAPDQSEADLAGDWL